MMLASEKIEQLLAKTSRTFALAIPLLPPETAHTVGLSYLLFRWADIFEDATLWSREKRIEALEQLVEILEGREPLPANYFLADPPSEKESEIELLGSAKFLLEQLQLLPTHMRERVVHHTIRTCEGMSLTLSRADENGNFIFTKKEQLKEYCYFVAGIVGELLTDVFVHDAKQLASTRSSMDSVSRLFGEGLQLVNILKDASNDSVDGRTYLPSVLPRSDVFAWARESLQSGNTYVKLLQHHGAPNGFVAFCGISLLLAFDTLDALEKNVKMERQQVLGTLEKLLSQLEDKIPFDALTFNR